MLSRRVEGWSELEWLGNVVYFCDRWAGKVDSWVFMKPAVASNERCYHQLSDRGCWRCRRVPMSWAGVEGAVEKE